DEKFKSFNWNVQVIDGHDFAQIHEATQKALTFKGRPSVIIGNTVKGKGISFMENQSGWHGKAPNKGELELALKELDEQEATVMSNDNGTGSAFGQFRSADQLGSSKAGGLARGIADGRRRSDRTAVTKSASRPKSSSNYF
ncbi:MAG: hypothetical protein WCW30_00085, partial [Candidatus Gracilibacteria bacterium]